MKKKSVIYFLILAIGIVACVRLSGLFYTNEQKTDENATTANSTVKDSEVQTETDASEPEEALFTVKEVKPFQFESCPTQLELVNLNPCVLADGMVYLHDGDAWQTLYSDTKVKEVYGGEYFCALTEDGKILLDENVPKADEIANMSGAVFYNAEELLKNVESQKLLDINRNIVDESVMALLEDGTVNGFYAGSACKMMDSLDVKALDGNYVLTDSGEVYFVKGEDGLETAELELISEEKIIDIFAASEGNRCVGLKEDGTVVEWEGSNRKTEIQTTNISKAAMGFYYCIVLDEDGRCYFYTYDNEKLEEQVNSYLKQISKKAIHITCAYERVVIMYEDYSMCIIDFGNTK